MWCNLLRFDWSVCWYHLWCNLLKTWLVHLHSMWILQGQGWHCRLLNVIWYWNHQLSLTFYPLTFWLVHLHGTWILLYQHYCFCIDYVFPLCITCLEEDIHLSVGMQNGLTVQLPAVVNENVLRQLQNICSMCDHPLFVVMNYLILDIMVVCRSVFHQCSLP